jgi:hypothetical protein
MAASSTGGKVSFFLTFQLSSPRLTSEMMISIGFNVNEIVSTCDNALTFTYIHLQRKARKDELHRAMRKLTSTHGVSGSNIFGYDSIDSNSLGSSELIDDHPGFKTLVQHQAQGNSNFHRWTADGYSDTHSGYNKLKSKLLSKRTFQREAGGGSSGGGDGGRVSDDDEQAPGPSREQSSDEKNKRKRSMSPDESPNTSGDHIKTSALFDFMRIVYEDSKQSATFKITQLQIKAIDDVEKKKQEVEEQLEQAKKLGVELDTLRRVKVFACFLFCVPML